MSYIDSISDSDKSHNKWCLCLSARDIWWHLHVQHTQFWVKSEASGMTMLNNWLARSGYFFILNIYTLRICLGMSYHAFLTKQISREGEGKLERQEIGRRREMVTKVYTRKHYRKTKKFGSWHPTCANVELKWLIYAYPFIVFLWIQFCNPFPPFPLPHPPIRQSTSPSPPLSSNPFLLFFLLILIPTPCRPPSHVPKLLWLLSVDLGDDIFSFVSRTGLD